MNKDMTNKTIMAASFSLAGLLVSSAVIASGKTHWSYSGEAGPQHWGKLSAEFSTCATGKNQSPINITGAVDADLPDIKINYKAGGSEVVNNGHSIQINYAPGSTMSVSGHTFELKQFHFHSPSENTINGKSFPLEAHYVHADKDGNLAVIAVMFNEGDANAELAKVWAHMPGNAGEKQILSTKVRAGKLLPEDRDYYRFNGSLTTPPCSEGVLWLVMDDANTASKGQIEKFATTMSFANNRPVRPINARLIVK
jgi:carbonic anhydrase